MNLRTPLTRLRLRLFTVVAALAIVSAVISSAVAVVSTSSATIADCRSRSTAYRISGAIQSQCGWWQ